MASSQPPMSREKARAQRRLSDFVREQPKDWERFTKHTARKSFVKRLGDDPLTDPKLLRYADNMNRLKTGSRVGGVTGDGGKSYDIIKLRGTERLGCTCNDWRYKRSVAQLGEDQDCKHIKQFREMSKTAELTSPKNLTHNQKQELQKLLIAADEHPEFKGYGLVQGAQYDKRRQAIVSEEGKVVGFMTPRKDGEYWRTGAIFTDPAERGKGHAHRAISEFFSDIRRRPGRVWIAENNNSSRKAFQAAGFQKGKEHIVGGDRGNFFIMQKEISKTAARFQDNLPKPIIDGKPHDGTWTIVGSGRLSIPKKTSDIDYMVPLEEIQDLSSFQEYKDVPGVYWRDLDPVSGRPATVVAVPRYAYNKIDSSYQQAVDRFGKRKLRQLKKTLPKDSFYKDIGVVYTSDAMKKQAGHVEDRIAERAPGAESEVMTLRSKLRKLQLRKGQTYHIPLSRGKGYAVIGDVGDHHAVKTVLGPNMRPPGERLKLARAPRDYKKEYDQYHAKPEQVENRSLRNQARRKLGLKKGDPREVDHKTPLAKGGGNGHSNLRAVSRTTNRKKFNKRIADM